MEVIRKIARRLFSLSPGQTLEGYENNEVVNTIFRKTVSYAPSGSWPAIRNAKNVLDFGGGCGLHYKLAVQETPDVRWAVVETPTMVSRASELATERLKFFSTINEAVAWLGDVEVVHSNGALQYTPDPVDTVGALCKIGAPRMLWFRVYLTEDSKPSGERQSSWLFDHGPSFTLSRKRVVTCRTAIPERTFLDAHAGYRLEYRVGSDFTFVRSDLGSLVRLSDA